MQPVRGLAISSECPACDAVRTATTPGWCGDCGHHDRLTADELVAWLLPDAEPIDPDGPVTGDPLSWPGYTDAVASATDRTGTEESVLLRRGSLADSDVRVVAIVWEFGFLGGSMGAATGQRIAAGYDHARRQGLPVLLLPATGGARMQEGMASLVQMAATTVAATAHRDAGLLQVAVLRNPTTGGPFASHVNLADVLFAEPGATIGFAGPRVSRRMTGGDLPAGSHTATGARDAGLVDAVVARPDLPARLGDVLRWTVDRTATTDAMPSRPSSAPATGVDAWDAVQAARAPDRARAPALLAHLDQAIELSGDRAGHTDPAVRVALARLGHRRVVVVAMDTTSGRAIGPAGYRTAWRGLAIASRCRVPVVTLVDTPGADASAEAEALGIASHIARTFALLLAVDVPTVSLVVGQGGSGGALALAVTDRLLIQEQAIFTVIAPEGAAEILRMDDVSEVSRLLDPTGRRLVDLGIADEVVPDDQDAVAVAWDRVARHLDELAPSSASDRLAARRARWRRAGAP